MAKGAITTMSCDPAASGIEIADSYVLDEAGNELSMFEQGTWQLTNVFGNGELLATYDAKGLHFHLKDALGTRRVQTDDAGAPEEDCTSLPFGDQASCALVSNPPATADDATPLHFTGKERDTESGNDYFGARYYGSSMGRFISPDPSGLAYADPSNPQSFNLYSYVANNPLTNIDPSGLDYCAEVGEPEATVTTSYTVNGVTSTPIATTSPSVGWMFCIPTSSIQSTIQGIPLSSLLPPGVNSIQAIATSTSPTVATPSTGVCTGAGAVAGASAGALIGGAVGEGLGGLAGGGGGTLVAPGVGTVGGGLLGAQGGGAFGATVGAVIGGAVGGIVGNVLCSKGGTRNILPSWAGGQRPNPGESASQFAKRLCDARYGPGNYPTGPGSEYNLILKWARYKFGI